MSVKMFAAIDVGSYELSLKIVEFVKGQMKVVDTVVYRLDLGTDTYATGKIPSGKLSELIRVLREFAFIMRSYKVTNYKAYGTSALRETINRSLLLDQIELRTGIHIDLLSNSEQRFLNYKSVASKSKDFLSTIEKGTAIADIGGGSIQISLFDNDKLDITQNIDIGVIRLYGRMKSLDLKSSDYENVLFELIDSQLSVFKRLYVSGREIRNLIIVDDYLSPIVYRRTVDSDNPGFVKAERFNAFYERLKEMEPERFSMEYGVPIENIEIVHIAAAMVKRMLVHLMADNLWAPGATLTDGIAYEYGERKRLIAMSHDFDEDIVACARGISRRYMGDDIRSQNIESLSLSIFDSIKKISGLDKRDRLILRLAGILHDCGKYISLHNMSSCSYDIIMSTEIIGLSHDEREILANVVKHNHTYLEFDIEKAGIMMYNEEAYQRIAKLTAILRLANGMDKSKKQKFSGIRVSLKDDILEITIRTNKDITLEKGLFEKKADFFEEIFNVRPVIRQIAKL